MLRGRIRRLPYTVAHDRIGIAGNDPVFGEVSITWQGNSVGNLFSSVLTLTNDSSRDFSDLHVKVWTGNDTLLLNESTEVEGTTQFLKWEPKFAKALEAPNGARPSEQQFVIYHHNREYTIPVLNRGQSAVFRYLTTSVGGAKGPSVWAELQQAGLEAQFVPQIPLVHGVPQRFTIWLGLVACLAAVAGSTVLFTSVWTAASISCIFGLFAQGIGAVMFRALRFLKRLFVH
jgi:hypothetical protein